MRFGSGGKRRGHLRGCGRRDAGQDGEGRYEAQRIGEAVGHRIQGVAFIPPLGIYYTEDGYCQAEEARDVASGSGKGQIAATIEEVARHLARLPG